MTFANRDHFERVRERDREGAAPLIVPRSRNERDRGARPLWPTSRRDVGGIRLEQPTVSAENAEKPATSPRQKSQRNRHSEAARGKIGDSDFAITVDTREPEHTAWRFADSVATTRACLPSGDYAPTGYELQAVVERKTAGDFIACVTYERRRFWGELERLRAYSFAVVIVETSADAIMAGAYRSQANPWAVLTSALAIMCDFRVPVLFAGDRGTSARCCEWLLRRWVAKNATRAA